MCRSKRNNHASTTQIDAKQGYEAPTPNNFNSGYCLTCGYTTHSGNGCSARPSSSALSKSSRSQRSSRSRACEYGYASCPGGRKCGHRNNVDEPEAVNLLISGLTTLMRSQLEMRDKEKGDAENVFEGGNQRAEPPPSYQAAVQS